MTVRAKFKVDSIEHFKSGTETLFNVKLSAVYGNGDPNHENTKFFRWTPSASIQLGTVNPAAAEQFELGKEFYVDFSKAE
jgi:hypothetical protein